MTGRKILIVEDDGIIAMSLMQMLSGSGYGIAGTVASGEEALELLLLPPYPDLVLMDVGLDGMLDGIDTAHRIHADYRIPVILLTANPDNPRIAEALGTSVAHSVNKPFLEETILDGIEQVLGGQDLSPTT